jgi:hypothetical protein
MENYGGDRQAMLVVSDRSQLLFSSAVTVDSPPLPLHHYCICKEITRAHIICSTPLLWNRKQSRTQAAMLQWSMKSVKYTKT